MSTVRISGSSIQNTSGEHIRSTTGGLVNWKQYRNATSVSLPTRNFYELWNFNYTKLGDYDETYLLISAQIQGNNNYSGDCGTYVEVNGQKSGAFNYTYSAWANTLNHINGNDIFFAPKGDVRISTGWNCADTSGGDRPFNRWNNSGGQDDGRIRAYGSTIWVREFTMDAAASAATQQGDHNYGRT